MKKLIITTLLLGLSANAFALRCGTKLIRVGDPIFKVVESCNIAYEYQVNNQIADIRKVYIKMNGVTHELKFIDGTLRDMKWTRF